MTPAKPTVVITGAGSGLGRGLSIALAQNGYAIVVTDKDLNAARETAAQLPISENCTACVLDVTSHDEVIRFARDIADRNVGVLINNAGLQHVARLEDFPQEHWDLLIDVMLNGAYRMTRALLPGMREEGYGRIINIGSIHSLVASPYKTAYTAAKHGLLGFSKVVALETAETDITINTICPSYIRTPLVDAQIDNQAKVHDLTAEEVIDNIMLKPMPKKSFISVEEVAGTIEFLISSDARNITGQAITIDGGWTVQ